MAGYLSTASVTVHGVAAAPHKLPFIHSPSDALAIPSQQLRQTPLLHAHSSFKTSHRVTPSTVSNSAGAETSAVTEETTDLLDSVLVYDLNGNGIPISDLWKDRKAVVAFARHFGCVLCRTRAAYLAAQKDKMDAAGVSLVLIGPGSVDQVLHVFSSLFTFGHE